MTTMPFDDVHRINTTPLLGPVTWVLTILDASKNPRFLKWGTVMSQDEPLENGEQIRLWSGFPYWRSGAHRRVRIQWWPQNGLRLTFIIHCPEKKRRRKLEEKHHFWQTGNPTCDRGSWTAWETSHRLHSTGCKLKWGQHVFFGGWDLTYLCWNL